MSVLATFIPSLITPLLHGLNFFINLKLKWLLYGTSVIVNIWHLKGFFCCKLTVGPILSVIHVHVFELQSIIQAAILDYI